MRAVDFDYHCPLSLDDAHRLLAIEGSHVLAGGQWLIPELMTRQIKPMSVIDIRNIASLSHIRQETSELRIGSCVTAATIANLDSTVPPVASLILAVMDIGSLSTRNRATIGGNIAQAGPAMPLTCLLSALGATVTISKSEAICKRLSIARYRRIKCPRPLILDIRVPIGFERSIEAVSYAPTILGMPTAHGWIVSDATGRERKIVLSGIEPIPVDIAVDPSEPPRQRRTVATLPEWIRPAVVATLRGSKQKDLQ